MGSSRAGFGRFSTTCLRRILLSAIAGVALLPAEGAAQQEPAGQSQTPPTLPPVTVQERPVGGQTEGTGSYGTPVTTIGTKDPTPVRQIPQSVTVVTRSRIQDQNMTQLEDAFRRTTGMVVLNNDPGRSSLFSRGFELDNVFVDGLPAPVSSIYGTQPDLAMFDRVEILRGPSGLFAGNGEPGGTVNLARKRALKRFTASGALSAGSWENFRGEVDVTGPLVEGGRVRGRAVGAFQNRNGFVDHTDNQVALGYGTIEIDVTDSTTLALALWHQQRDITPFNGLPAYANGTLANVSRSTFIGAGWNRFENRSTETLVELNHRFDGGGHARAAMRYANRDVDFKYAYGSSAINPVTGAVTMQALATKYWEESLSADAHVSLPVTAFGQTHTIVLGMDYRRYWQTRHQGTLNNIGTSNIFNPTTNIAEPVIPLTARTRVVPEQFALYGQVRVKPWSPLTLVLGSRLTWYDSTSTNLVNGATTKFNVGGKFTPYAGVVLDITGNISAYASYTSVFQPQTAVDASGNILKPREGHQYEAGLKGDFFGGALQGSMSLFRIRDRNRAMTDPGNPAASIAAGEVEVKGFEVELSGSPVKGWEIYAGYTHTRTEYIKAATTQQGQTFSTFTPRHMVNLWTKYTFQEGPLRNFHIGAGARIFSSFYTQSGAVRFRENGYVVVDAQIGYKLSEHVEATLTATNLFDEKYYARVGSSALFNFYGEPFAVMAAVRVRF